MSWTFDLYHKNVTSTYSGYTFKTWDKEDTAWDIWRMIVSAYPFVIDNIAVGSWTADGAFTGDKFIGDLGNLSTSDKVLSGGSFIGAFSGAGA